MQARLQYGPTGSSRLPPRWSPLAPAPSHGTASAGPSGVTECAIAFSGADVADGRPRRPTLSTRQESMQLPTAADVSEPVNAAALKVVPEPLDLALRPFLAITCLFWLYACLRAVLDAYGMSASLAAVTDEFIYAPWEARVLQYLFLLPALLLCYWSSLRLGWRPAWRRLWPQLGLAIAFAIAEQIGRAHV